MLKDRTRWVVVPMQWIDLEAPALVTGFALAPRAELDQGNLSVAERVFGVDVARRLALLLRSGAVLARRRVGEDEERRHESSNSHGPACTASPEQSRE